MEGIIRTAAIIAAGGSGLRLPGEVKKQYRLLAGKPVLIHTLEAFLTHPLISDVILALPESDLEFFWQLSEDYLNLNKTKHKLQICRGGEKRQDSVYNALISCPDSTEVVLIHDGVRPFITHKLINKLINLVKKHGAGIPATRIHNTVKSIQGDVVENTLPRENLVEVHTPQGFRYNLICDCYAKAKAEGYYSTDDAALAERYGVPVHILFDKDINLKITDEADIRLAGYLITDFDYRR